MLRPCSCAGYVHVDCLNELRRANSLSTCRECRYNYRVYIGITELFLPLEKFFMVIDVDCKLDPITCDVPKSTIDAVEKEIYPDIVRDI